MVRFDRRLAPGCRRQSNGLPDGVGIGTVELETGLFPSIQQPRRKELLWQGSFLGLAVESFQPPDSRGEPGTHPILIALRRHVGVDRHSVSSSPRFVGGFRGPLQLGDARLHVFPLDRLGRLVEDHFRGPNPGGWRGALFHHHLGERRHGCARHLQSRDRLAEGGTAGLPSGSLELGLFLPAQQRGHGDAGRARRAAEFWRRGLSPVFSCSPLAAANEGLIATPSPSSIACTIALLFKRFGVIHVLTARRGTRR